MEALARRILLLKTRPPTNEAEKRVAALVRDERYQPFLRILLPLPFTEGKRVYLGAMGIESALLPGGVLRSERVWSRLVEEPDSFIAMTQPPA
jgi:hypothetical protein